MESLFERMIAGYHSKTWQMSQLNTEDTILVTEYQGYHGQWMFFASTDEVNQLIIMFARTPESCPLEKRLIMSEFIDRANFRMTHGAWLLDHRDGEMRYRLGIDMGEMELTPQYLQDVSYYVNMTMDAYLPGIRAIIAGEADAIQACHMVFPKGAIIE